MIMIFHFCLRSSEYEASSGLAGHGPQRAFGLGIISNNDSNNNSMAYGTRKVNVTFRRVLQLRLPPAESSFS